LLAITLLFGIFFFQNRKKNQQLKLQAMEMEQKKKTAQAVMQAEEEERKRIAFDSARQCCSKNSSGKT
jgi:signal transduction histidine kinase